MAEEKEPKTGNKKLIILMVAIVIAVIIGITCLFIMKKEPTDTRTPEQMAEEESVEDVQDKIKKQEEKIEKINQEMTPLIEERDNLEKQLMELTSEATSEDKAESTEAEATVEE